MRSLLAITAVLFSLGAQPASARDWSFWRGPEQNGVSREKNLPEKWSPDQNAADSNLIWSAPVGGRTTPIVQNGRVYLITGVGDGITQQERVVCFDADTGKQLWEHRFNVFLTDIVADRLGWSNMVGDPETDTVYAHGTQGLLFCFDRDGKVLWQRSLTEEFGRVSGYGGRVTSPIIDGDLLILSMLNGSWGYNSIGRTRFVAMDKRTGKVVWWASTGLPVKNSYYSVPVVAVINGERLVIGGGGDGGVHAFKVRTGEHVWTYLIGTDMVNCSPVVDGSLVYIGQGEPNPDNAKHGKVVCLDASQVTEKKPKLVWEVNGIRARYASPALHEGRLYICDDLGRLYCLDAKTGKRSWSFRYGRNTKGSPVVADGKIYIGEVDSRFLILKPEDRRCELLHEQEFPAVDGVTVEINGSPAIVNGRVYFMTSTALYCLGKKGSPAEADPIPPVAREEPAAQDAAPAYLQVYPGDILLRPGQSEELKARAFDDKGRLLGEVKVDWSLGPQLRPEGLPAPPTGSPTPPDLKGELSSTSGTSTKVSIPSGSPPQFGRVVARHGKLEAGCRVRVVAPLPIVPDLSRVPEGRTPAGWVNAPGKFAVQTLKDGSKVIKKLAINPAPPVARVHTFLGTPEMKDYTIEADVQGQRVRTDLPDIGVGASRYLLQIAGNTQLLRLQSWDALPRIDKTIPFEWKEGVWYRLKLTTTKQGDKVLIQGKAWEADKPEPEKWTVEVVDPVPNLEGAPSLYANATGIIEGQVGCESYFRNIKVTPNK